MSDSGSSSCSTACDFASSSSDSVTFNQISVAVAVLIRDENCCAAVLLRAILMWREALQESAWPILARRALRHDRVLLRLSALLTAAWMRLARRTLHHDRVLFRLSVVLTATWMRLARGALRFERARQSDRDPGPGPWSRRCAICLHGQADHDCVQCAQPIWRACGDLGCHEYNGKPHVPTPRQIWNRQ